MKRSEAIEKLASKLFLKTVPLEPESLAKFILTMSESIGMLPPCRVDDYETYDEGCPKAISLNVCQWENEDEKES